MIDLTKKVLPNTVMVGGRAFRIDTDYRTWLRFLIEYEKFQLNGMKGELDISYLFTGDLPVFRGIEDYSSILMFAFPVSILPKSASSSSRVLDYEIDADYIYSAFLETYGIDLIDIKELHWHKFRALLHGLSAKLTDIMGYRSYTGEKIKDQEEVYRRLKDAWELPELMTEEERKEEEEFNKFFEQK